MHGKKTLKYEDNHPLNNKKTKTQINPHGKFKKRQRLKRRKMTVITSSSLHEKFLSH